MEDPSDTDTDTDTDTDGEHEFDRATTVHRGAVAGTYDVDIHPGFTVGPKPNGGYLLACIARAATAALAERGSAHRHVLAATAHFLGAPDPGPASIQVAVLREGRTASQVHATLSQGGRPYDDVTFTLGVLPEAHTPPTWSSATPFELAPQDQCMAVHLLPGGMRPEVLDRFELWIDPAATAFAGGKPSGRGQIKGWVSFANGRPVDPLAVLFFLDALPPPAIEIAPSGWVPTLSLTAYLRAVPAPGLLRIRVTSLQSHGGWIDEVCDVWDSAGTLVGQATQLAAIRFDEPRSIPPFPT